ncbi:MAG TPA: glycosyltransferase [Coriobacteriia bacterium]|nr:glycosyltransferase [Coriobacteriia bacterium]
MLLDNHVPVRLSDISPGRGMKGKNADLAEAIQQTAGLDPFVINLFHLNPDQMLYLLNPLSSLVTTQGRMNISVPFWELPKLPPSWIKPLEAMDLILAPTRYIEDAVREALPNANVIHFPQAVHVPDDITADRARFGLPNDAIVFVSSFDMRSDIERKNPWAAIEAFHRAFPDRDDVRLVVKVNNVEYSSRFPAYVRRLAEEARDHRVIVNSDAMGYRDVLSLYASSDVLLSLHRAEGLGLSLLEAMSFGKVVVATAFSGNMDFMTPENSCPVPFTMVPVQASTQPAYSKRFAGEQEWAEPDVDAAATALRALADSPELRARLGSAASATAQTVRAGYDNGLVLTSVRTHYATWAADPGERERSRERVLGLERSFFGAYAARIVRAGSRRLRDALRGGS